MSHRKIVFQLSRLPAGINMPALKNQSRFTKKYMKARMLTFAAALALLLVTNHSARAQGTAFTYQGQLNLGGVVANGDFDLRFGLYTNLSTTNIVGSLITNSATAVSNGLFTTTLNFGNVFNGTAYWLEIGVRSNGSAGAFTTLTPRQPITPAPYAIMAGSASNLLGTLPASQLSGIYSNAVSFTNTGNILIGNGSGLTGLPTQTNYLFAVDTNIQSFTSASAFQALAFSTILVNSGWTYTNGSFTVTQPGFYLVQYQIHAQNQTSSTLITPAARAVANLGSGPIELLGSESAISLEPSVIGELTKSFEVALGAGQTLTIEVAANYASPYIYTYSAGFYGGFFPDATLTIVRIQ
jgi:hypothetical protein